MGNNQVMFIFNDIMEMERMIANGPWSFDKFLILLKHIEDDKSFSKVTYNSCSFWVQIHDLPARFMNPDVCIRISRTLGTVEQVENIDEGRGGINYMRVRVLMNVEKPLC